MEFERAAERLKHRQFMTPWQGRKIYDHLRAAGAHDVLEIGTAFGVSAGYMAAALDENGGGTVTTVDRYHFGDPSPEEVVGELGLTDRVDFVRTEHSSYCWWLKEQIEARSDAAGNCEPAYDFCYLDGSHEWHMDGLAVVLIERLLRPGAWLLLDDLDWTHAGSESPEPPDLSEAERTAQPVRAIWDTVLRPHAAFDQFRIENDAWGWAHKGAGRRKYEVQITTDRSDILMRRLRMLVNRYRRRV